MTYSREREALNYEGRRLDENLGCLRSVALTCGAINPEAMAHIDAAIELLGEQLADLEVRFVGLIEREEREYATSESRRAA